MFEPTRIADRFVAHPRHSTSYGCGSLRAQGARIRFSACTQTHGSRYQPGRVSSPSQRVNQAAAALATCSRVPGSEQVGRPRSIGLPPRWPSGSPALPRSPLRASRPCLLIRSSGFHHRPGTPPVVDARQTSIRGTRTDWAIASPSLRGVAEEAPGAYKDVSAVVAAAERAQLA